MPVTPVPGDKERRLSGVAWATLLLQVEGIADSQKQSKEQ